MIVVLDTNILISGLIGAGPCREILRGLKASAFELGMTELLLAEFVFVVSRPKISSLISFAEKEALLEFIKFHSCLVESTAPVHICRDPEDDKVIDCAIAARADFIVTLDNDLLILRKVADIPIILPQEFIEILRTA
jgi:putative PIN family toxin of toxin-antitoxin system